MSNIKSFPNNQDEYVGAEWVMRWLHGRTSGVWGAGGNAAVTAHGGDMSVDVSDGLGWMANDAGDGIVWWNDTEDDSGSKLNLSVTLANASLPRIDRVVVSWETTDYAALPTITVVAGTPSSDPNPPALTNNNILRQISLAQILVPASTTEITADLITDERLDATVCGLVTESVTIDTTTMAAQFNALLDIIRDELESIISANVPNHAMTHETGGSDVIIVDTSMIEDEAVSAAKLDPSLDYTAVNLTAEQVRVIKMGTATPTTSDLSPGEIYLKYS